ncbi:MAG: hypothetical protein II276_01175 [Bacteroidales bacterium]|nr:hypothetical protein [Bacteroidales bacterium]
MVDIAVGATVEDLDFAYVPPFSTAIHPIVLTQDKDNDTIISRQILSYDRTDNQKEW